MTTPPMFDSFVKRMQSFSYVDPVRDWLVLVICSLLVLVGIIVWNVWAFDTVANGGILGAASAGTSSAFNRSSLDSVHAVFTSRAAEEAKYASGAYRFSDPSL